MRVASDVKQEEQLARTVMNDYYTTRGSTLRLKEGGGCSVCTNQAPCLFDVIADPSETSDLSKENPAIVKTIQDKIATGAFLAYIGTPMNASQLSGYTCPDDIRPWWGNFSGPCCKPK